LKCKATAEEIAKKILGVNFLPHPVDAERMCSGRLFQLPSNRTTHTKCPDIYRYLFIYLFIHSLRRSSTII